MKLLLTGDLHLGRTSTRTPERWVEMSRTLQAWTLLVEAAVAEKVQAVLISGDLIDQSNRFWETIGPFTKGVRTLSEAGIETLVISGNHDASVLPSVAKTLSAERFTLLGANGQWERKTLSFNGAPALHVDGWSFPEETVYSDPTESYSLPRPTDGIPVLGMVHGDPGVATSRYAPLSLSRLQSLPLSGWLLGHIHAPSFTEGSPWVLMPGTPHPLDPGEPGAHHAWICEITNGALTPPRPFCPSRLQYTELELSLTPDIPPTLEGMHRLLRESFDQAQLQGHHVLRLRITGTTRDPDLLEETVSHMHEEAGFDQVVMDRILIDTQPEWDLDALRKTGPVPKLLVDARSTPPPELEQRIQQVLDQLNHQSEYEGTGLAPLSRDDAPIQALTDILLRQVLKESE
jgi:DNA repair exonuclease SbcCD nuclease subunit